MQHTVTLDSKSRVSLARVGGRPGQKLTMRVDGRAFVLESPAQTYAEAPVRRGRLDSPWERLVAGWVPGAPDHACALCRGAKGHAEEQTEVRRVRRSGRMDLGALERPRCLPKGTGGGDGDGAATIREAAAPQPGGPRTTRRSVEEVENRNRETHRSAWLSGLIPFA